jgi:H+/gluconate symporter-like permease
MGGAGPFLAQFFPLFLLGEDSGSVETIASFITEKLGAARAMFAVVLAGAIVTYGSVNMFIPLFIAPIAESLFKRANIPRWLMPAGNRSWCHDLHHVGATRHAGTAKRIPMPFLRYCCTASL